MNVWNVETKSPSLTKIKGPSPLDSVRQAARAQPLLLFSHPPPPCGALSTTRAGGSSSHTRNNTRLAVQGTASQEFKHDNRPGCTQWSRMYNRMGGSHHGHDQGFVNHRGHVSSIAYPNRVSSIAILTCVSDRSTLVDSEMKSQAGDTCLAHSPLGRDHRAHLFCVLGGEVA